VLGDYLASISEKIKPFSDTPSMDASVLLAGLLDKPRAWVIAHPEASLVSAERAVLENALKRLEAGEPLPYILGHWEFYGLEFLLNPATLIPRPETELLVEQALEWLKDHPDRRRIADVGTGSGCIAISLACHLPDLRIIATDISGLALQAALANARRHGVSGPINFIQGNLLDGVAAQFDLICANLPYIPCRNPAIFAGLQPGARSGFGWWRGRVGLDSRASTDGATTIGPWRTAFDGNRGKPGLNRLFSSRGGLCGARGERIEGFGRQRASAGGGQSPVEWTIKDENTFPR
jgi:hypothetical protein